MEQLTTATLTQLPQVRALGRHTGRDPLTLFWTASGMELEFTGSELWVDLFADYEMVEPWVSVELNGAWVARFAVNPGKSRICLFRGMTPGKAKHLRLLKDVQAMHDDPAHLLQITGLEYAGGEFLPLPEPQYRLEFVGDSITSGEGAIGAKPEEDWVGAFFSAENHYGRRCTGSRIPLHLAKWLGPRDRLGQRCAPCDAALLYAGVRCSDGAAQRRPWRTAGKRFFCMETGCCHRQLGHQRHRRIR